MVLKTLIIDDEPLAHKVVEEYSHMVSFLEVVGHCYTATKAIDFLHTQPVDLLFLDIQMPGLTGIELLETLRKPPLVIITSAYNQYALESYQFDVCDYLLKPFRLNRFLQAANKALDWHKLRQPIEEPLPSESGKVLFIKSDKKMIKVAVSSISHIESFGNFVKVWQTFNYILTAATLTHLEAQLPNDNFIRVHKSFIVNQSHLEYVEGNIIGLTGKVKVVIGKSYRQEVRKRLGI